MKVKDMDEVKGATLYLQLCAEGSDHCQKISNR